jgi:hypothetical protein
MWDLWRTKWHWDRFFFEYFGYSLTVPLHQFSVFNQSSNMDATWCLQSTLLNKTHKLCLLVHNVVFFLRVRWTKCKKWYFVILSLLQAYSSATHMLTFKRPIGSSFHFFRNCYVLNCHPCWKNVSYYTQCCNLEQQSIKGRSFSTWKQVPSTRFYNGQCAFCYSSVRVLSCNEQERQCTNNVTLTRFRLTIVAAEKQ